MEGATQGPRAGRGKRSRRRRRRRGRQQKDWSDLPNPALFSILQRLTTFRDLVAFDGVCRSWRAVSRPALGGLVSSQPPLLCGTGGHHFRSFPHGPSYRSTLPGLCRPDATLVGFSQGYFIMTDSGTRLDIWLVNPFTGDEVFSVPQVDIAHSVEWVTLTAPPASPGCALMAWCRFIVLYWKHGDTHWSKYWCETEEERGCSRWPVVLEGSIYARSLKGKLMRFEFDPQRRVIRFGARDLLPGSTSVWLVASGGEILAIHAASLELLGAEAACAVYRLDRSSGEWARMETLGGRALLFTPVGPALCHDHPDRWGGEGDCVYFFQGHPRREVKVFRLDGGGMETLRVGVNLPKSHSEGRCCCLGRCCSSFIWVLPGLCYC